MPQNDVAAGLVVDPVTRTLERMYRFGARNNGKLGHTAICS
jgi:hypothetical protein